MTSKESVSMTPTKQAEKEEEQKKEQNKEYREILNVNRHLSIIDLM